MFFWFFVLLWDEKTTPLLCVCRFLFCRWFGLLPKPFNKPADTGTANSNNNAGDGGQAQFLEAAKKYGQTLGDSMLSDIYRKVTTRLKGAIVQLQAMRDENERAGAANSSNVEDAGGADAAGLVGFGKAERLSGFGVGGAGALKGGLVKKHTFQV